jgi:hypothetical protein
MSNEGPRPRSRIRAMRMLIDKGAGHYDPDRHLDRLLGGHGIWSPAADDPAQIIARLKRALRSQRRLGKAGHWSYDLNRHFGLLQALKAERARARALAQTRAAAGAKAVVPATSGTSDTGTEMS